MVIYSHGQSNVGFHFQQSENLTHFAGNSNNYSTISLPTE